MKTAVYLRVSTRDQDVASQAEVCKRWLAGHGVPEAEWYIDQCSGKTLARPRLAALQEAIFNGEIQRVVMYDVSRFARSMIEGLVELDQWKKRGVLIVFVKNHLEIGAAGPWTDMFVLVCTAMALAFAEQAREEIRARQADGIAAARKRSADARRLHKEGWGLSTIAAHLKTTTSAVEKMLKAKEGRVYWGGCMNKGRRKASPTRVYQMWQQGAKPAAIAKVFNISQHTVARYLKEHDLDLKVRRADKRAALRGDTGEHTAMVG